MEAELALVPAGAWREVVPQLLARLHHPRVRPAASARLPDVCARMFCACCWLKIRRKAAPSPHIVVREKLCQGLAFLKCGVGRAGKPNSGLS